MVIDTIIRLGCNKPHERKEAVLLQGNARRRHPGNGDLAVAGENGGQSAWPQIAVLFGTAEICLVHYDNEIGKGDHRHYGDSEEAYLFQSIERLVEDFRNDCVRLAGWEW